MTIRLAIGHFLFMVPSVSISSRFRDNRHQTYWDHDLDLSGSRDVISHVTIRVPIPHFLATKCLSLRVSKIFCPKPHVLIDTMLYCQCACAMCIPYVKFKYIFQFLTPHFAYSLCHFHWAPTKTKGCFLSGPVMLKAKSSENFLSENLPNFDL